MKKTIVSCTVLLLAALLLMQCSEATSGDTADPDTEVPPSESDSTAPPQVWKEHWFEHDQLLQRIYYNEHVALYYDSNVDRSVTWPESYFPEVWEYVKSVYGDYGDDPRLFVILHTDNYSGGHPSTYMSESHDYRNVLDVAPYSWTQKEPAAGLNMAIHEIGHIVEGATNGIQHNPAWNIWKDSKWAEIFIYDVYKGTGEEQFAAELYGDMSNQYDDFPTENTRWFIDWFYPIYNQHGESEVLNNFYDLLADHFPKNEEGNAFSRRMNWGEFIHFWSGAAEADLKPLAKDAFGWSVAWEYELQQARDNFPALDYVADSPIMEIINISSDASLTVSRENPDGPHSKEGSANLTDNDLFSKFFIYGYSSDLWIGQEFAEAQKINAYMLTPGNDYPSRDPRTWILEGSIDGQTWETIDTQEDITFEERNQTKSFQLAAEVSYPLYRLSVTENAGSADFQLSEWRLLHVTEP